MPVPNVVSTMQPRNGPQVGAPPSPKQSYMSEVLEHLRSISLWMDVVWTHLFDKPESSGEKNLDDHVLEFTMRKDNNLVTDTATGGYAPRRTQSPFSGQCFLQQERVGTPRFEGHTF